jgi:protein phosphatase
MSPINCAGLSDPGRVRASNEDRWAADPGLGLYVVADGLGGPSAGALAAQLVVDDLPALVRLRLDGLTDLTHPEAGERLAAVVSELSTRVHAAAHGRLGLTGMGAAVVLALVRAGWALVAHLGDCRAYLLRDGRLKRLTRDHSLVRLLLESGDITPAQATCHPARGQLTRYAGMEGEPLPEVRVLPLRPGDRFLLCSDGLTGALSDEDISSILLRVRCLTAACARLIAAANANGGQDNATVLALAVSE